MFKEPLRRDPLVVGWALCLLLGASIALTNNTEWSGHLEADRVQTFLGESFLVLLWSVCVLLFLVWLRQNWRDLLPRRYPKRTAERESALPWTDRWISDVRQADAERREGAGEPAQPPVATCRHGVRAGGDIPVEQVPVLRSLSVSHHVVRPGSTVSVTWCFEHATDVVVDGRRGHPACGETTVPVHRTRPIEVIGRNRHASTPAATPAVVATAAPQPNLASVTAPPPVTLHLDLAATVGGGASVAQRLDALWAARDARRSRAAALPTGLVGVPASLRSRLAGSEGSR